MSIEDLDLILKKDPIIATWPARNLRKDPAKVEEDYLVHARTHLSLGNTSKYVDAAFKWVTGENKGAFIGAVLGRYGEGKTSFLVHLWAESQRANVFTIPPFEWSAFEEIASAISGWVEYVLRDTRPALAKKMQREQEKFQKGTLEQRARAMARDTDKDYASSLEYLRAFIDSGDVQLRGLSADRLLDLVAEASEIVQEGGYKGLLVLLDEPEVAAKKLGNETVQHFLFDLSNELHRRQGNYGVFISMPRNFFASAQRRFSALTARLEARKCFPRLGDIYGPGFAEDLWRRYVEEFGLGEKGRSLVTPLALQAIGQVGSSSNGHLSHGPRSVVSAFNRMVERHLQGSKPYRPQDFTQDVLDQEIMVKKDYPSELLRVLRSPEINEENREAVKVLGAFPSGLRTETLQELGIEEMLRPLARPDGPVRRTMSTMRLRGLRKGAEGERQISPVEEMIYEFDSEYAPDRRALENALSAFAEDVIPQVFRDREGQQLLGWQTLQEMEAVNGAYLGAKMGAFEQTVHDYPNRAVILLVNSLGAAFKGIKKPTLDQESGPADYDFLFHFALRWREDQEVPAQRVEIQETKSQDKGILVRLHFDLTEDVVTQDNLAELVGQDRLTLLYVLNLLERMRGIDLDREFEAQWTATRRMLVRRLLGVLFGPDFVESIGRTTREELDESASGSGLALIGSVASILLHRRYPDYDTLIHQPHWQSKIDDYVNALSNREVPLSCKRGRELWKADGELAARVLGTSRMNLTGGAFEGYDSLIEVESKGRSAPLEIEFHIHPLEQEVRDLITAQPKGPDRKLKRGGKECWYMSLRRLLPVILGKGYTLEELRKIIEIGKARGSFDETERYGERVLYCKPLDIEELKQQLRSKLHDLVEEIGEYKQLPDYTTSFDSAHMEDAIESIQDDADYDRLITRMNKEFRQNHSRLPGYFDRVQGKLKTIRRRAERMKNRLSGSREARHLEVPSAKSPWGAALGRYIVPNLQKTSEEIRKEAEQLLKRIDNHMMRYSYSQQRKPAENLSLVCEGWSAANDVESVNDALCSSAQQVLQHLQDYGEWRSLLRKSDQRYERFMELQKDPAHQAKAEEFMEKFDELSHEIEDHLECRNVNGLPHHRQFLKRFEKLEQERQEYVASLKGSFDKRKDQVNQLISQLKLDGRVRAIFNPLDIGASYDQLYSDGADIIQDRALQQTLTETVEQQRDLMYARDVLQAVDNQTADSLLTGLEECSEALRAWRDVVDEDWLRGIVEDDNGQDAARMVEQTEEALEIVRGSRRKVRKVSRPSAPGEGRLQAVYERIPEDREIDLKGLVLAMMDQVEDPSRALDVSLDSMADLFRRNCIHVRVERRRH